MGRWSPGLDLLMGTSSLHENLHFVGARKPPVDCAWLGVGWQMADLDKSVSNILACFFYRIDICGCHLYGFRLRHDAGFVGVDGFGCRNACDSLYLLSGFNCELKSKLDQVAYAF